MSYKITDEQKKALLQYSAQTLPDNPSREGFSAESIRKRMYKPIEKLIDLVNSVFDTAYTDVKSIITAIQNGDLFARSVASWSASYTYGADEITFYPSIGTYGAFVQSVVAGNTNNAPYVDGAINSAYWKEVVNFNTVTEDYFQQVQEAVAQAESAASEAETQATAAAGSASAALTSAENANQSAQNSAASAKEAERQASYAINSASAASGYRQGALNAANSALQSKQSAETAAQNAADSATEAQQYAQQAQQYAQKHYQVVASVSELPRPGDSAFIYLVPTGSGTTGDSYSEYLWITESNDYEFIGTTADIDLLNYAQINGTYAGMTVGNATNAQTATNAQQLGGVAAANYAQTNGTYSGMTVGKATQADNAATATDSEKLGGVLAEQYAINTGTYAEMSVGNADSLGTIPAAQYVQVNAQTLNTSQQQQVLSNIGIYGNIYFGRTVQPIPYSNDSNIYTFIQCSCSGFTITSGIYYFINCQGVIIVSGANAKVYITDSPNLTVSGITPQNWFNVYQDGVARFTALNSTVSITKDTAEGTSIVNIPYLDNNDEIEILYRGYISGFGYAGYKLVTTLYTSNRTTLYANVSRRNSAGALDEHVGAVNINIAHNDVNGNIATNMKLYNSPETDVFTMEIRRITVRRRLK